MYYDLNIPWSSNQQSHLPRTLVFLQELGYSVIALNHTITGKLPSDLKSPIPDPLPSKDTPSQLTILRRCTLVLTDSHSNARIAELSRNYDILAVRPIDEKTLQLACASLDCDIISLDLTQRLPYWFKFKMLKEAVMSGKRLEICYAQGIMGDANARRSLISNATQLIRASRGRGLILSSEAPTAVACRAPWDVVNLAAVWGLSQDRGVEAVGKECRGVVLGARLKRTSFRGVVDVVYGGEKPAGLVQENGQREDVVKRKGKEGGGNVQKRKADAIESTGGALEKPPSKRQMKRDQKAARLAAASLEESSDMPGAQRDDVEGSKMSS